MNPYFGALLFAVAEEDVGGSDYKEAVVVFEVIGSSEYVGALAWEMVEPLSLFLSHLFKRIPSVLGIDEEWVGGGGTAQRCLLPLFEVYYLHDACVAECAAVPEAMHCFDLLLGGQEEGVLLDDFLGVAVA